MKIVKKIAKVICWGLIGSIPIIMPFLAMLLAIITIRVCVFKTEYLPTFTSNYFDYAVQTKSNGEQEGYLIGFTELALQQKYLVLPNELNGTKITGVGYWAGGSFSGRQVGRFEHEKLEKLFYPTNLEYKKTTGNNPYYVNPEWVVIKWGSGNSVYVGNKYAYGYNLLDKVLKSEKKNSYSQKNKTRIANVSYMYNYEGAENDGYYWVDYYNETAIDFVPPKPERKWYTFGGWYKEPECINEWNFETDVTSKELWLDTDLEYEDYNPETLTWLYAKWDKN